MQMLDMSTYLQVGKGMDQIGSTSDRILDTAEALVVAGGYNGFSYADISDAIGIRKASIHHHFPTKADLVTVMVERYRKRAEAGLNALRESTPDPVHQLQGYVGYWRVCIAEASAPFCVCAMLAGEMQMLPESVAHGVRAHFDGLANWLATALALGEQQKLLHLRSSPKEEAHHLMAAVHGAMLSARAFGDPALFATVIDPQMARLKTPA